MKNQNFNRIRIWFITRRYFYGKFIY